MRKITILTLAASVSALAATAANALTPSAIQADITAGTITTVTMVGSSAMRDQFQATLKVVCASSADEYGVDDSNGTATTPANAWDGNVVAGNLVAYNGPDFRAYSCTLAAGPFAAAPALNPLGGTDILVYYRSEGGSGFGVVGVGLPGAQQNRLNILSTTGGVGTDPASNCTKWVATAQQWGPSGVGSGYTFGTGGFTSTATSGVFQNWICPVPAAIYDTNNSLNPTTAGGYAGGNFPPASGNGSSGWFLALDQPVTVLTAATCTGGPPCGPASTGVVAGTFANGWTNPNPGNSFPSDLVADNADVGVTDVEPAAFTGETWAQNYKTVNGVSFGLSFSAANLANVAAVPVLDQMFGVIYNTTGANSSFIPATGLSSQSLRGIFTGEYTNWNQVPELVGTAAPGGAITICRRDPTSGTQAQSAIFFNNFYCGSKSTAEVLSAWAKPNGTTVQMYATGADLEGCVSGQDAVGIRSFTTGLKAPHIAFMPIDGIAATQINMLKGLYRDWYEVNYMTGPNSSLPAGSNALALFTGLVQFTSDATSGTVGANGAYMYLANAKDSQGNNNNPAIVGTAGSVNGKLALVTRSKSKGVGQSCFATPKPLN
jgi:hypothetical protein